MKHFNREIYIKEEWRLKKEKINEKWFSENYETLSSEIRKAMFLCFSLNSMGRVSGVVKNLVM